MADGYYYCLNCHSEITPDYNEHCCFCGASAIAVDGDYSNKEVERAFDLLNKEQQGLVIVPPCKVGDTVYRVDTDPEIEPEDEYIEPYTIENIVICKDGVLLKYDSYDGVICHLDNLINGTKYLDFYRVFLSKEEAEKALQK